MPLKTNNVRKILLLLVVVTVFSSCSENLRNKDFKTDYKDIRLNQLGFYPASIKQFVLVDTKASSFAILDEKRNKVFDGRLVDHGYWDGSGERIMFGDFSLLTKPGTYYVSIDDALLSYPFQIKKALYQKALRAAVKSYYFQRASMPIDVKYGGIYKRAAGHMDNNCLYHPSTGRSGAKLKASGGWYDAGDYGKYIGNASLSTGQMLLLLEQYPGILPDASLNIPESGNGASDLKDELKYELDWILKMQDEDGGVYHKLTAKIFSGFVMPADYDLQRWVIGKGTAATLNFAAVMAQASRIYKSENPIWSAQALRSAERAWDWAMENDSIPFSNPEGIQTGEYGDNAFSDDFYWAAAELYISTQNKQYLNHLTRNTQPYTHQLTNSWKFFVRNNAFHSLLENRHLLEQSFAEALVDSHLALSEKLLFEINQHPYRIAEQPFEWGSNSDVLNQAVILCVAHRLSGEEKYLDGAEQLNDYIFGKNATAYCFLTGFGSKRVLFPHHRPSGADGIDEPIPGFIVGGPNNDKQDVSQVNYATEYAAKAYVDVEASYASNEVCINWNAPAVYVLSYLEQNR